jgi:hypothetical protein
VGAGRKEGKTGRGADKQTDGRRGSGREGGGVVVVVEAAAAAAAATGKGRLWRNYRGNNGDMLWAQERCV